MQSLWQAIQYQNKKMNHQAMNTLHYPKIETVYFDMDGVLVNLHETLEEIHGKSMKEVQKEINETNPPDKRDPTMHLIYLYLDSHRPFVKSRPTLEAPVLKRLISSLAQQGVKTEILSSATSSHDIYTEIEQQKREWLENNGLGWMQMNFTYGKAQKKFHATPKSLLVDDTWSNIKEFTDYGGYAFYYNGAFNGMRATTELKTTLEKLTGLTL